MTDKKEQAEPKPLPPQARSKSNEGLSDLSLAAPVSREEFEGLKARIDRMQALLDRASSVPGLESLREQR